MNLYLVQHAEAKTEAEDPQRSLSDKGLADIEKTAKLLATKVRPAINVVLHSGKLRARQTAEVLADYLSPIGGIKVADGLNPNDNVLIWAEQLGSVTENVILVGHLPHLSRLCARLLCGDESRTVVKFRNAGIVCLERDERGQWTLEWLIVPGLCD